MGLIVGHKMFSLGHFETPQSCFCIMAIPISIPSYNLQRFPSPMPSSAYVSCCLPSCCSYGSKVVSLWLCFEVKHSSQTHWPFYVFYWEMHIWVEYTCSSFHFFLCTGDWTRGLTYVLCHWLYSSLPSTLFFNLKIGSCLVAQVHKLDTSCVPME